MMTIRSAQFLFVISLVAFVLLMASSFECFSFGLGCDGSRPRMMGYHFAVNERSDVYIASKPAEESSVFDWAMENVGIFRRGSSSSTNHALPTEDQVKESTNKYDDPPTMTISHVFSPYTVSEEFLVVSNSWRIAADRAMKEKGIRVELIGAVLPEDADVVPSFARRVILTQRIPNYRKGANDVPTYGEMFKVLRDEAKGTIVIYSNADIAVVPDFYMKVHEAMQQSLASRSFQIDLLNRVKESFFATCRNVTLQTLQLRGDDNEVEVDRAVTLCARDAAVYYENLGGRPPHFAPAFWRYFKDASDPSAEAFDAAYDSSKPDRRIFGNAMTITRRQLSKLKAADVLAGLFPDGHQRNMNETYLDAIYEKEGEDHPGNDLFVMPRAHIPQLLTETPFIHLRPSGFLIGQLLKYHPNLVFRRIMSTPEDPFTFHIGLGTDEYPYRANAQSRQVLFEAAQYFTRLNITKKSFWPPTWCTDGKNYRVGGTAFFCATTRGDYCRGWVRLSCTTYWHRGSRDTLALEYLCERISKRVKFVGESTTQRIRTLDEPFCSFCNDIASENADATKPPKFRCTGSFAEECKEYPCLPVQEQVP